MMTRMPSAAIFCLLVAVDTVAPAALAPPPTTITTAYDIPQTKFNCDQQDGPGIYADIETGCQVFHFCQEGGRMDSFFCPNQTLFSQQYFVCDWYYNVDCSSAPNYFSLNQALYNQPDKSGVLYTNFQGDISRALQLTNPGQVDLQEGASELSRSLNNLVTKLDGQRSGIVDDSKLVGELFLGNIRRGKYLTLDRKGYQGTAPIDNGVVTTAANYKEIIEDSDKASYAIDDYSDTADPEPVAVQIDGNLAGYNQIDDQGADPEPAPEADSDLTLSPYESSPDSIYQSNPGLYSLAGSYAGSNYNLGSYSNKGSNLVDSSYSGSNPDIQEAIFSTSDVNSDSNDDSYLKADVYDSADPEPTNYDYYDSADPEPSASLAASGDSSASSTAYDDSSASLSAYVDSSPSLLSYDDSFAALSAYDDSSADPEPALGYYQTSGDDNEPGADPEDSP